VMGSASLDEVPMAIRSPEWHSRYGRLMTFAHQ
jgi:hypothetical protein